MNAHLYPSAMRHETRMLKITGSLAAAGVFDRIRLVGIDDGAGPGHEQLDPVRSIWRLGGRRPKGGGLFTKVRYLAGWSVAVWGALRTEPLRCVNAHSLTVLPLSVCLKWRHGAKLVYDTHELETESAALHGMRQRLAKIVERLLMPFVDEISVVCDPIADWYRATYARKRIWVVKNIPPAASGEGRSLALRELHSIAEDEMLFIYQGVIGPGRPIEEMLRAFEQARPDQHIVFMGYGSLVPLVRAAAATRDNVHFQEAVSPDQIRTYTSGADVGLAVFENLCLSYYLCLPNKLFEYLHAGVPVLVSDFPGLAAVVRRDDCGWVVSDMDDSLAVLIRGLTTTDVATQRIHVARAQARYGWEHEEAILLRMYRVIFGAEPAGPLTTG